MSPKEKLVRGFAVSVFIRVVLLLGVFLSLTSWLAPTLLNLHETWSFWAGMICSATGWIVFFWFGWSLIAKVREFVKSQASAPE